ncbi:flagellar basal body-associated FliL family protein [Desulfovibrio sp. 86]|uniref:Flagellar protein FliL n=1 Tax=uncultured Desulfovibrio sp. TaxID=167968 RepID=A0A212L742_9BACT|nr:flagellar basal body-associated FliL family protein [Desulfovibrio sp. 86]SCM73394.1 Flagellar basal body-associated protein FliL [uncultured Desulfovibrio sp.]VZH34168.1 Flagellar protein FliL [Desulfovibrio sp. 86]
MAAKEKEAPALPEGTVESPKKKSRVKRIVIILAILLMTLSGAGIGGYWWLYLRTPSSSSGAPASDAAGAPAVAGQPAGSSQAGGQGGQGGLSAQGQSGGQGAAGGDGRIERQSDLPRSGGMVLPLPSITVNLSDPTGRRYLKMGMEVEVNADVSAALQANNARIRDAIIMLLAGKNYADISTPDGKVLLKAEVAARLNQILGAQRVIRVYFTDFVVE